MFFKKKGQSEARGALFWIIIGVIVLVLVVSGYFVLSGKISGVLEIIKNIFRFGG